MTTESTTIIKRPPVYSGVHTMLGFPYSSEIDDIKNSDIIFYGMPFDIATSNRPGTRFGPRAVRKNSFCSKYHIEFNFEMLEDMKVIDYGDFDIPTHDPHYSMLEVTRQLDYILENTDGIPIGVGGDHALTFAELRSMKKKHGPVAFIHFDSHTDTWDSLDEDGNTKITHGTPFRMAIKQGSLDAHHGIQLGMRGGLGTPKDHDFAINSGMTIITGNELHEIGMEEAALRIKEKVADRPVYVTFDIDFLDPAFAPGTGTPVVGGFTTAEALKLLRLSLTGLNIVGCDLVEVAPQYDTGDITSLAAQTILREFVAIISYNKKNYIG